MCSNMEEMPKNYMNAYDFDGTIYAGDSSKDFYLFVLKKHPGIVKYLPYQISGILGYFFNFLEKTQAKERFFSFLKGIPNLDCCLNEFWSQNRKKIKNWYIESSRKNDVIISASPYFLLKPICDEIGVSNLIASEVNRYTGKFEGKNCYGKEKVRRFFEKFPEGNIAVFYSDSISDSPLQEISQKSFLIKKDTFITWDERQIGKNRISIEFLRFLAIGGINAFNGILFASIFSLFWQENVAFICGYMMSLLISYVLNSFITFQQRLSIVRYFKFCVSYIPNFTLQNLIVILFLNILHWPPILVYTLAVGISVPVTYLLIKYFAFKKDSSIEEE